MSDLDALLERVGTSPTVADVETLLGLEDPRDLAVVFGRAHAVRTARLGKGLTLRGIVEYSSICRNGCLYCGLRAGNPAAFRYRLTDGEVLEAVDAIARRRIGTVVLQGGEDPGMHPDWMAGLIRSIKRRHPIAVTLAAGEADPAVYAMWKEAGADRYLLKIETTDPILYRTLHPGMDLRRRMDCLEALKALGYETGTGLLLGLPGQTPGVLARDLLFLRRGGFSMIGSGPFIPHPGTPLAAAPAGEAGLTLKVLALTRLLCPDAHLPSTTALRTADAPSGRAALRAGADVVMPNFTPLPYRRHYAIYPSPLRWLSGPGAEPPERERWAGGTDA